MFYLYLYAIFICVCIYVYMWSQTCQGSCIEARRQQLRVLLYLGSGDESLVIKFGGSHLYPLSHTTNI